MKKFIIIFLLFTHIIILAKPCSIERWDIKTLQDDISKINFNPVSIGFNEFYLLDTLKHLGKNQKRLKCEMQAYKINVKLIEWKIEKDSDFHLVCKSIYGDSTFIAEIPLPECANPLFSEQFKTCRDLIKSLKYKKKGKLNILTDDITLEITGILFHDFVHCQTGHAPNGIELHPVVQIKIIAD